MDSIRTMIDDYKMSCKRLENRIRELDFLAAKEGSAAGESYARRRALLYAEMWDMLRAVREMEEYEESVSAREALESRESNLTA